MKRAYLFVVLILLLFQTRLSAQPPCAITLTSASGSANQQICSNTSIAPITYFSFDNTGVVVSGLPTGVSYQYSTNGGYGYLVISGMPAAAGTYSYSVAMACDPNTTAASGTITVYPIPDAVATPSSQTMCFAGTIIPIALSSSIAATTYTWVRNSVASLPGIGISGVGNITGVLTNPTNATATTTFTITPSANGCPGTPISATVLVNEKPDAIATPAMQTVCSGTPLAPIVLTGSVTGTTFSWTRDHTSDVFGVDETGLISVISGIPVSLSSQPALVAITITPTANGCTGTPITANVMVNPTPYGYALPTSQAACSDAQIEPILQYGALAGTTFSWSRGGLQTAGVVGIPSFGSGSITGFLQQLANIPITITFTIVPTANGCTGPSFTSTVRVDPIPDALAIPASQSVCSGVPVNTILLSGQVNGTSFDWTRDNVAAVTGIGASGSGNISGALVNTTNVPVTVTFTITPTASGCPGTSITATVMVNPTPNALVTPASQITCSGSTINAIAVSSSVAGASYTWTRDNNTAVTGIGASGTAGISGALTNSTVAPETVIFTITPTANNCAGPLNTASVLVNPAPNVLATPVSQTICSGDAINTIIDTSFVTGSSFSWTRNAATSVTGIAASGSGSIGGTLTNTGSAPITVSFVITPTANACTGPSATATVLVNPTPNAIATPASQSVCSGVPINTIVFSGSVSSTVFIWTRDNVATVTGILASNSGNVGGTLVNRTASPLTVTFTVSPLANGCTATPTSATVLVNPTPISVAIPASQSKCSGSPIDTIKFSSNVNAPVFSWTRDNGNLTDGPVSGIEASGLGNVTGALINRTNVPQTVTFTVTTIADGCTGTPFTSTVLVYPTPVIDTISDYVNPNRANYTYCNRDNAPGFFFASLTADSSFTWTGGENIGFGTNGSGNILPFVAKNTGAEPLIDTITVSIISSIRRCAGPSRTFTVTVNPSPPSPGFTSLSLYPDTDTLRLCAGADNVNFNVTDPVTGVSYKWSSSGTSNASIKEPKDPNTVVSFQAPGTYYVQVTATRVALGCTDSVAQRVDVSTAVGIQERSIFLKQPGNILIYPDNSLNAENGYRWGYDSLLQAKPVRTYSAPVSMSGQVYQFFVPGSRFLNTSGQLDTVTRAFWVLLRKGECNSRVYYNGPYAARKIQLAPPEDNSVQLKVIPNPSDGAFSILLEGNIYGNMQARVYNAVGQVVYSTEFRKTVPSIREHFNTGHLPNGLYYIGINSSDLKQVQTRFVIQR